MGKTVKKAYPKKKKVKLKKDDGKSKYKNYQDEDN